LVDRIGLDLWGSRSLLFEDYFKFYWELEDAFEAASYSGVVVDAFLWVCHLYLLDELAVNELDLLAGAGYGYEFPYFIGLLSDDEEEVDFG
jgi:hypothetical protein